MTRKCSIFVAMGCLCIGALQAGEVLTAAPSPRILAPGVISTELDEAGGVFTPAETEFYFSVYAPYTTEPPLGMICVSRWKNGRWSIPERLPFSGMYWDLPPHLTPDGNTMVFGSTRPLAGQQNSQGQLRIWQTHRTVDGWADPQPLPEPINSPSVLNFDASVASDGTVYFTSMPRAGGTPHVYSSRLIDGRYTNPEMLPAPINSDAGEMQPFIAPDQSYLLFVSIARPGEKRPHQLIAGGSPYPRGDIYISYRRVNGWGPAHHLGAGVNTFAHDGFPSVTSDGRYLVFSSERSEYNIPVAHRTSNGRMEKAMQTLMNGRGNIFYVDMAAARENERQESQK